MKSRNTINFILDFVSFLILLGLVFTGYIMRFVLLPGTGGLGHAIYGGAGRGEHLKELWSMTRHEWGSAHFYLAAAFAVLMIIHIAVHWRWITCYVKSLFNAES